METEANLGVAALKLIASAPKSIPAVDIHED